MTISQSQAVWELCRQGLPLMADDAENHWDNGRAFELPDPVRLPREVRGLIELSNWEAGRHTEARRHN